VCAKAEALPFADASFDFVISKAAIAYVNIPVSLREIHRVLMPGGTIWVSLNEVSLALRRIAKDLLRFRIADIMYQLYAIGNGYCLSLLDRQFPWVLNRSRTESTQTVVSMAKALIHAGFTDVQFDRDCKPIFAMSARKA
jgi:ubiquinone/menaquinone biosynthesis C-methylase UbiE